MKKVKELSQGNSGCAQSIALDLSAAFLLLAGTVVLLGGCSSTHSMRTTLAVPPPAFDPSSFSMSNNTAISPALIEPAAGNVEASIPGVRAAFSNKTCGLRIGGTDALFYQWGENRLGLGVGTQQRDSDFGQTASLRYSISLHEDSMAASKCSGRSLLD